MTQAYANRMSVIVKAIREANKPFPNIGDLHAMVSRTVSVEQVVKDWTGR